MTIDIWEYKPAGNSNDLEVKKTILSTRSGWITSLRHIGRAYRWLPSPHCWWTVNPPAAVGGICSRLPLGLGVVELESWGVGDGDNYERSMKVLGPWIKGFENSFPHNALNISYRCRRCCVNYSGFRTCHSFHSSEIVDPTNTYRAADPYSFLVSQCPRSRFTASNLNAYSTQRLPLGFQGSRSFYRSLSKHSFPWPWGMSDMNQVMWMRCGSPVEVLWKRPRKTPCTKLT